MHERMRCKSPTVPVTLIVVLLPRNHSWMQRHLAAKAGGGQGWQTEGRLSKSRPPEAAWRPPAEGIGRYFIVFAQGSRVGAYPMVQWKELELLYEVWPEEEVWSPVLPSGTSLTGCLFLASSQPSLYTLRHPHRTTEQESQLQPETLGLPHQLTSVALVSIYSPLLPSGAAFLLYHHV